MFGATYYRHFEGKKFEQQNCSNLVKVLQIRFLTRRRMEFHGCSCYRSRSKRGPSARRDDDY